MLETKGGIVIQFVKFRSDLSEPEVLEVAETRASQFRELPGLLQKYYAVDKQTGEYAGIYIWESIEALREFRESELFRTIPSVYKIKGPPRVEILNVVDVLRPEK